MSAGVCQKIRGFIEGANFESFRREQIMYLFEQQKDRHPLHRPRLLPPDSIRSCRRLTFLNFSPSGRQANNHACAAIRGILAANRAAVRLNN